MPSGRRVTLDADIWLKILCLCSAADIVDVSRTCTALAAICENPKIWYYALLQVSYAKRLPNLRYRIPSMPARIIKEKALTSVSLDEMWGQRSVKPTKTYQLSVPHAHTVAMLPGGDWILLLGTRSSVGELQLFETDIGKPARRFTFTESEHIWTDARLFISSRQDNLVLVRSQGQQTTVLSVYQLITTAPSIQLKFTMSIQPKLDGYTAMDDYVAYGWVEPSGKHFIKLMRLDTDYRTTVGQCTMEVELRPGKYMHHSYALRLPASVGPRVLVSNTQQIALYDVPELLSKGELPEPEFVTPIWRFDCSRMSPRAVHLIPEGPIVVLYADRYLIIEPYFDLESPHPTYVGTYFVPHSLDRPHILGPHRAFWDCGPDRLASCALPPPCQPYDEDELVSGYFKVEGRIQPRYVALPIIWKTSYDDGCIIGMAWDEESGRLSVLVEGAEGCGAGVSLIVSDMHAGRV